MRPNPPKPSVAPGVAATTKRVAAASGTGDPVRALALALGAPLTRKAMALLRCTLILCADHELNTSTFAARVAASTGADLYACLSAAVAA